MNIRCRRCILSNRARIDVRTGKSWPDSGTKIVALPSQLKRATIFQLCACELTGICDIGISKTYPPRFDKDFRKRVKNASKNLGVPKE